MSPVARLAAPAEPGLQPLAPDEEAVVRSLSRVVYSLPRAIDADMVREQRLSLTEYLTLMNLSEASDRQLRMGDLANACDMSLSGMTRLASRLESRGLIQRVRSEEDARGWNAILTDAGFARLEEAYPTHLASVRRHFLDHFSGLDLKELAAALRNVAT
ncbi:MULTISPECIES: MarR family winged helix-turn-helix transcriptional regulator [Streptomyces]|uniref:MarR family transcriptional regulator n=1 Tax=Streptomyces dengpaensis TaxID=2049881 RepID=A0ABN5HYS8_9ACTN|nr:MULTISPECIES: MarR family transcriptional regulator [Streptomyces]AVH55745.1 MarR family transcriptional regulator [Streptomyces dengpaensis]PIB12004.1 MarR family transcriptional regulator [Streptomyces sp. HG99]